MKLNKYQEPYIHNRYREICIWVDRLQFTSICSSLLRSLPVRFGKPLRRYAITPPPDLSVCLSILAQVYPGSWISLLAIELSNQVSERVRMSNAFFCSSNRSWSTLWWRLLMFRCPIFRPLADFWGILKSPAPGFRSSARETNAMTMRLKAARTCYYNNSMGPLKAVECERLWGNFSKISGFNITWET